MSLLDWFLEKFSTPADREPAPVRRGPRFPEGTQWTCPVCDTVLTTAKCDIYYGEAQSSRVWEGQLAGSPMPAHHCGVSTMRCNSLGHTEIHTPTGWVG